METLGGNEVNPGYRTKTIAAEVSQGQSRHQNTNKNEVNCKIEKNKSASKKISNFKHKKNYILRQWEKNTTHPNQYRKQR